ncbi:MULTISPECIES: SDR family oxidoreductase [Shewanella]|jgi:NAD(P)-dependent dehydrogenase (short-subunit alcohol dehydrogenase family)|uniref:SDR family oxidoreductase n=1 Tax=Shewanella TaxID=22 RepID=UPI001677814A|nr:SDR family oxidoreductase [Shewanella fodinae]MCL2905589.1 SDR family oxidoreductase [Shewanella fodinae]GGY92217.1 oxidoreductase [Shewanella fodinae]
MPQLLITGANRGIGLALTELYLASGWDVVACCRDPSQADDLLYLISDNPGLEVYQLDVTDYDGLAALARELDDRPIDLLINNAGYYGPNAVLLGDIPVEEWRKVLEINTIAPLKVTEAFLPQLRGAKGTVACISSKMGSIEENHSGGSYLYRSSKAALNAVNKSLALDLSPDAITAVVIHPGWVRTDMGGPHGLIDAATSAQGIKALLDRLTPQDSGKFFDYQGRQLAW